VSVILII